MGLDLTHHHTDLRLIQFLLHLLVADGLLILLPQVQNDPQDLIQHGDGKTEIIKMYLRKGEHPVQRIQKHRQGQGNQTDQHPQRLL